MLKARRGRGAPFCVLSNKECMKSIAIISLLVSFSASADISEGGRGMLFGADHAFAVTATPGWILDNQSAVHQGLHMVFYPREETWSSSPVIIYGQAVAIAQAATIESQVEQTISDFRRNGSPNYSSKATPPFTLSGARTAEIYHYTGDQWGNYEAAAYIQETDTINFLVFNAKTKESFEKYLVDFKKIVSSYQNLHSASIKLPIAKQDHLKIEASAALTKPGGKQYEAAAIQAVGNNIASAMRDCIAYLHEKPSAAFNYFVRITSDGGVNESFIFPSNALSTCFNGLMYDVKYPNHSFGSFVLNIEMKVDP